MNEGREKQNPKYAIEALNPRYAGATPEMVGRALLRPVVTRDKPETEAGTCPSVRDEGFQSSILFPFDLRRRADRFSWQLGIRRSLRISLPDQTRR